MCRIQTYCIINCQFFQWKSVLMSRFCWPFRLFASGWNLLWRPCPHKTQEDLSQQHTNSWSTSTIHSQGKHYGVTNINFSCICWEDFVNGKECTSIAVQNVQFIPMILQQAVGCNWSLSVTADKQILCDVLYLIDVRWVQIFAVLAHTINITLYERRNYTLLHVHHIWGLT